MKKREIENSFPRTAVFSAFACASIAVLGLISYLPGFSILGSLHPEYVPMAPSTSICFIFFSLILILREKNILNDKTKAYAKTFCIFLSLFCLAKFLEYFFSPAQSFESYFIKIGINPGNIPVGIMASPTGGVFVLAGTALVFLLSIETFKSGKGSGNRGGMLGAAVIVCSITFILGYVFGEPFFYGMDGVVPMALTTALAFLLLGTGIVASAGKEVLPLRLFFEEKTSAKMLRAFVPLVVGLVFLQYLFYSFHHSILKISSALFISIELVVFSLIAGIAVIRAGRRLGEDIDRKKEALSESEARFRRIVESSMLGMVFWDSKGHITDANDAFLDRFGYTRRDLQSGRMSWKTMTPPEYEKIDEQAIKTLKEKGVIKPFEKEYYHKDGRRIPIMIGATVLDETNDKGVGFILDITERKTFEEELKAREFLLNQVGQIAKIGGWEMDLEYGGKAAWTKGTYDIVEIAPGEPIPGADEHIDWYLPEYRPMIRQKMQELIETRKPMQFEAMLKTKKGNLKWCRAVGEVVEKNGKVIKLRGTFQDVTENRKTQEEIENLARFPEENPNPVMRISKEGKLIYANNAAQGLARLWQISSDAPIAEQIRNKVREVLDRGSLMIEEICSEHSYSLVLTPVRDEYVNIYGYDITKRKKAEEEVAKSRAVFQELFENMSSCGVIYEVTDDGSDFKIKAFNKSAGKAEKIDAGKAIGTKITDVFPGVKDFGLFDVLVDVQRNGIPADFPAKEYRDNRISGWRHNYVYKLPSGEVVVIYDDLTEKKKAEAREKELIASRAAAEMEKNKAAEIAEAYRQLKEAQEQLIQAEKLASIGQLSAGVAHELNSPLAGVLSLLRSQKKKKNPETEEYEDLADMEDACVHMARIIRGLTEFARQSKGEMEELDCNEVIEATLRFSVNLLAKKGIIIEKNYAAELKKTTGIKTQIQQVVLNIVSNARDAMPKGGVFSIRTANYTQGDEHFVEMVFSDSGAGIKPENLKKVFDPFFTTKRPGGGVGLGLSISYKIVKNHNGFIGVESEEGKGAVFTVRLPAA